MEKEAVSQCLTHHGILNVDAILFILFFFSLSYVEPSIFSMKMALSTFRNNWVISTNSIDDNSLGSTKVRFDLKSTGFLVFT